MHFITTSVSLASVHCIIEYVLLRSLHAVGSQSKKSLFEEVEKTKAGRSYYTVQVAWFLPVEDISKTDAVD
jgi:hypothetical protein